MKSPDSFLSSTGKILGPIKGYTSLIQDDSAPGSNTRWWADKIMRDVESLEWRLECMEMFTMDGPEASETSWRDVIGNALRPIRGLDTNTRIVVCNEAPTRFNARGELLARALFQILRNACEATGDQGSVGVHIVERRVGKDNGLVFEVVVEDDGPGIPRSEMQNVRRPFVSTKRGHAGLGLPFVESVARTVGMGVKIESGSRGGTKVIMKIRVQGGQ